MRIRALLALAIVLVLAAAAPAAAKLARATDHISFPDATGDGDPDIGRVTVGSNAAGGLTFVVEVPNRQELGENEFIFVLIDSDLNAATGEPPNGNDYAIQFERGDDPVALFRWDGSQFVDTQSQTIYGYIFNGFRIGLNKSDLALTSNTLRFWVETQSGQQGDDAPDNSIADYQLSTQPLVLAISQFAASARTVKVGKTFGAAMRVHRSDLDENTSAGLVRCAAKVGKRAVRVTPDFPEDVAVCAGIAPKFAKGKTIKLTVTLELDGARVSRTASIRVK